MSGHAAAPAAQRAVAESNLELKVWLRLLACANLVLAQLRRNMRKGFGVTLPAFDVLAQIDRPPLGPTMGELSQRLMVSKGNVTDLIERLERRGLVERRQDPYDGRVQHVHLTAPGKTLLGAILPAHNRWIAEMMTEAGGKDLAALHELLDGLRLALRRGGGGAGHRGLPTEPHDMDNQEDGQ